VFYVAEPLTETRELRNISRNIPRPIQFRVLKRDNQICAMCIRPVLDGHIHFDHVIPWSKGGPTEEHNIRLLCDDCNRKRGANFEGDHLVTSFAEHVVPPVDTGFVKLLRMFVADAHGWRSTHGRFPSAQEVCKIVGVRKVTAFEDRMAEVLVDLDTLFRGTAPKEIKAKTFRALAERWGFAGDAKVRKLSAVAHKAHVDLSELISAEMSLIRRLGWPVKNTAGERARWAQM
jgi:hypothetical protein